jgi:hypothetical protein
MLENLEPIPKPRNCKVRTILQSLEPKDREILQKALTDPRWSAHALSVALGHRGLDLAGKLIGVHRKRKCTCEQLGKYQRAVLT